MGQSHAMLKVYVTGAYLKSELCRIHPYYYYYYYYSFSVSTYNSFIHSKHATFISIIHCRYTQSAKSALSELPQLNLWSQPQRAGCSARPTAGVPAATELWLEVLDVVRGRPGKYGRAGSWTRDLRDIWPALYHRGYGARVVHPYYVSKNIFC